MKREEQTPGARRVYHKDPKAARKRHRRRRLLRTAALLTVLAVLAVSVYWMLAEADGPDAEAAAPVATPAPTAQPSPEPDEEDREGDEDATPTPTPAPAGDTPEQAQARAALDAYLDSLPGSVSVLAVRPSDGLTYARNADTQYYAASLLKAPYALWLYTRAEAGEVNLDEVLPGWSRTEEVALSEEDAAAGLPSPTPRLVTVPDRTARDAVAEMVSKSSNGAAEQLYTRWPATSATGFTEFLTGLGLDLGGRSIALSPATSMTGTLSAADAVKILTALQAFFDTGTDNALELKQAFLDARHSYLVTDWPMAKKYGNWKGALHDIAIVYAPDPYYAAVFTDWGDPAKVDPQYKEYYRQISALLTALMES